MTYIDAFKANDSLINILGQGNAHMIWAVGLYLQEPDLEALASEALTDGPDDKKIDFILFDQDSKRIVFAQGYYGTANKDSAPANKASDLNTAAAWLISGEVKDVPSQLQPSIAECRDALKEGEVEYIELLYVHNFPESVNVNKELQTAASHFRKALGEDSSVIVISRELGNSAIEHLFSTQESQIEVMGEVICPAKVAFSEKGPNWESSVLSVPGSWLRSLFMKYGDALFSANYRGFLGISKRKKINSAIRSSAETKPMDFWAFNNGITILTLGLKQVREGTRLSGISMINGAQTTGSIGSVDTNRYDLKNVQVLCRIIQCSDPDTISEIIKYNNTQNEITTWDQYSNHPEQNRIEAEFIELGHTYSKKRGFRPSGDQIGIEDVVQPLVAFHGRFKDANRGKNQVFERKPLYNLAFEGKKARHILLVYALARAIDERRIELKNKSNDNSIISIEEEQLSLLRNLRFKYFFISVVAKTLEEILGKKVDLETIAFSPEAAKAENNSLVALVAAWSPLVESVLSYIGAQVNAADLAKQIAEEDALDNVSKPVGAMLYASRNNLPIESFKASVSDS